ncbi:natterin-3-like [Cottoperca gobio]|uniref:Natterin-3-like n=1 Tax=Cottoperca gobio TaxID=56716 RepID=A0A6J2QEC6_COTGO|nr:natterin-3-like [Cottoperca gobio]
MPRRMRAMKLSVLLLLALPALSSAGFFSCEKNDEPVLLLDPDLEDRVPNITAKGTTYQAGPTTRAIEDKLVRSSLFKFDQTNLQWQTFDSSLSNRVISIDNGYVDRTDYVCKFQCQAGFYNPKMGPHCNYPAGGKEYLGYPFEILVNKDNFEFLEWKDGSYGSVPPNSVKTCENFKLYVGKNKYGLGKVDVKNEAFFLPWKGTEYWYKQYQVLTFDTEIKSEHMSDVKYNTDKVKIIVYSPETIRNSTIINLDCQPVTQSATLTKTTEMQETWETSFSMTLGIKTSITAEIPSFASASIEFSVTKTFQFTERTTYIESITHSISVQHIVPPNHSCNVRMVAYKYAGKIPFTARLSRTYSNGDTRWTSISGTYDSVQIGKVMSVVDRCEPVPNPKACP